MSGVKNWRVLTSLASGWVARSKRFHKRIIVNTLFLGGVVLLCQGIYMDAKAIIAQGLIAHSWQQRTAASPPPKPWWWADTKAIAKLKVSRLGKEVFIMQDDSGESLAFGPGHLSASAGISQAGHVMVAGHRDSHFKFLGQLQLGDVIETTNSESITSRYKIDQLSILNADTEKLMLYQTDRLTLITCYPFNGLVPGGPLRYIVDAQRIES
ncbi:MAG: sortase A [Arenicella sp.]|jgi:sortase A